jgi:hypothetical protein
VRLSLKTRWLEKKETAKQTGKIFTHKRVFDNETDKQTPRKPKPWKAKTKNILKMTSPTKLTLGN